MIANKNNINAVLAPNDATAGAAILLEPVLVDKNNIESVIIGSGFYTKEQVYGKKK